MGHVERKQQEGNISEAQGELFLGLRLPIETAYGRGLMANTHSYYHPLHGELNRLLGANLGTQPLALILLHIYEVNNILFININNFI